MFAKALHFGEVAPSSRYHGVTIEILLDARLAPLFHNRNTLFTGLPCPRQHPSGPTLQQSWHPAVELPETVDELRKLVQEFCTTHRLDSGTRDKRTEKAVEVIHLDPVVLYS